jgi:3-keto-5-aminohexanoate cleavage enzyme
MSVKANDISDIPVIIESAISSVVANAGGQAPSVDNIVAEANACLAAGAGIIHYHHDFSLGREQSIAQCVAVQRGVLQANPGALIYPGYLGKGPAEDQMLGHLHALRAAGVLTMFAFDPGLATHGRPDADGILTSSITGGTTFEEASRIVAFSREAKVPCSVGIFEPGALRFARNFGMAGKFTAGTIVKLYFAGTEAWGRKGSGATFGLPPTREALDIYLSLLEGSGLPWIVSVLGGDIFETALPRYVLERGGNLRVGAEDPLRSTVRTNVEMVQAVRDIARQVGRPVADHTQALPVLSARPAVSTAA